MSFIVVNKRINLIFWFGVGVFAMLMFCKNLIFHYSYFHSLLVSSLWSNPKSFFIFYASKIVSPLLISSFLLLTRRWGWSVIVAFFVDIWCISNIVYHKTYDMFLTIDDILMAGNMGRAWSAVSSYFDYFVVLLLLSSILWVITFCFFRKSITISYRTTNRKSRRIAFFVILSLSILLSIIVNCFLYKQIDDYNSDDKNIDVKEQVVEDNINDEWHNFEVRHNVADKERTVTSMVLPFSDVVFYADGNFSAGKSREWVTGYVRDKSIISYFPAAIIYYLVNPIKVKRDRFDF